MANNSKDNDLYNDFVDMVNKVSTAVTKETSKPIADNIKTVTREMDKASQTLQKTSNEFERLTSAKLIKIENQTEETTKILKKTSNEIGSVATNVIIKAISPLNSEIQNTTNILKRTSDNIGSTATKSIQKGIEPLTSQIKDTANLLKSVTDEFAIQTQETNQTLKKTTDEISSIASNTIVKAITPLTSEIERATSILNQTRTQFGSIAINAIQKGIEPISGQIVNTTNILKVATDEISVRTKEVTKTLKKTSDEIGDVASQVIQSSLAPIQNDMKISSSAMTQASSNLESLYNDVTVIKHLTNKNFEEIRKVASCTDNFSKETSQRFDSIFTLINQENSELKVHLSTMNKSIQSNLATHLNNSIVKNVNYLRQDNEALKEQNRLLSNEIKALKNNQHKFNILIFSLIFLVIFSGILILGALAMIFKGMN